MTDTSPANAINDVLRKIPAMFDRAAYFLLGFMYQIFFNVASADLFNNATILGFYKRVQLIIGVFMVFELAITIMKGIVNPDTFMDSKSGIGSIITRIIFALILLTILVPISIPSAQTEYERQLNNNGLLFGTLYSLQTRLLNNNTLGRLILGTTDGATSSSSNSDSGLTGADKQAESLKKSANIFSSTILKGFYRINLIPEDYRDESKRKKNQSDEMVNEYRMCKDIDEPVLNLYTKVDAEPSEIIDLITWDCTPDTDEKWLKSDLEKTKQSFVAKLFGKKRYAFAHIPFVSAIVGFVFVVILLDFTIQIAIRAVKLAVLRLIAPIPIISYMDPKGGKDGAFNSWVKTLTSTYLDLFLRLAIIYFVIYLIQDMIVNGIVMNTGSGMVGILSAIIIWIGLFIFARQAPKFIRQVLGMKDDGGKLFGGINGALSLGAAAGGVIGSAVTNYRTAKEENEELNPNSRFNGLRNVGSAIAGAIAGGYTGGKAFMADDATPKKVLDAQNQRNAMRASHSTLPGRILSSGYGMVTGQTLSSKGNKTLEGAQNWLKAQGDWKSAVEEEAKKNGAAIDFSEFGVNVNARYEEVERAVASAHDGKVTINGQDFDSNIFTTSFMDDALKKQVREYQGGNVKQGGTSYRANTEAGGKLYRKRADVLKAKNDVDVSGLKNQQIAQFFSSDYNIDKVDTYGKAVGAVNNVISDQQNDMRQRIRNSNDQQK